MEWMKSKSRAQHSTAQHSISISINTNLLSFVDRWIQVKNTFMYTMIMSCLVLPCLAHAMDHYPLSFHFCRWIFGIGKYKHSTFGRFFYQFASEKKAKQISYYWKAKSKRCTNAIEWNHAIAMYACMLCIGLRWNAKQWTIHWISYCWFGWVYHWMVQLQMSCCFDCKFH